jgi:hypothetical protein
MTRLSDLAAVACAMVLAVALIVVWPAGARRIGLL